MAVTVQRGVRARLGPEATVLLQACSDADPGLLAGALATAAADIAALPGPKYVSEPMPTPDGPILLVDLGSASPRQIRAIPAMLARRIEQAGIGDAVVRIPPEAGERHERLAGWAPAVRAWLRGPLTRPFGPADPAPPLWLFDAAWAWLRAEAPERAEVVALVASAEVPLGWDSARPAAGAALRAGAAATLVASDFATAASAVAVCGRPLAVAPQAGLGAAGPGWPAAGVAGRMRRARALLRSAADRVDWAGVGVHGDARDLSSWQWYDRDPGGTRRDTDLTSDVLVPDGMWYQVLSAGHLDRLGGVPDGGSALPGGRAELTVGEPEQWLPDHPDRADVRRRARTLLAGCMAGPEQIHALNRQRLREARDRDDGGFFDG
ncbi:MAG TPA: hypothetical protein VFX70_11225 [Mycobacteriales bacterium]|nr:hypothetical protein [Mycobacteriales bacterium]